MPPKRDEIVRQLWHGEEPFARLTDGPVHPELHGWNNAHPYLIDFIEAKRPAIIVDIGASMGATTIGIASRLRTLGIDGVVIAIDTWRGTWDHWEADRVIHHHAGISTPDQGQAAFLANIRAAGLEAYVVPLPLDSINAAKLFRSQMIAPDLICFSGRSEHPAISADLREWWPLLKVGGQLISDGYKYGNDRPWIVRAFHEFFGPRGLTPIENTGGGCRVTKPAKDRREADMWAAMNHAAREVRAWREACANELESLSTSETLDFAERLHRYVRFPGPTWHHGRIRFRDRIVENMVAAGIDVSIEDVFGPCFELRDDFATRVLPDFKAHYPRAAGRDDFERFELLPEFENPFASRALPGAVNINMAKEIGPALEAFRATGVDLFVTGLGYQMYRAEDGIFWPAASTRAYPAESIHYPRIAMNKTVVIVQDEFEGSNFSHFLLDWMTRLGHFLNAGLADALDCVFLLGGIPTEFHFIIIRAMCEIFQLNMEQFIFPSEPVIWNISGPIWFFSDLVNATMHPMQMAQKQSIAIVREIASRILTGTGDLKKIYISRGDTDLRRLVNEVQLLERLRPLGFVEVRLAAIPLLDQIELVRGAEVIVAPHGMGLTHTAFHNGHLNVIELHTPAIGTDTYASIAHAMGFGYQAVFGTDHGGRTHHYEVQLEEVLEALSRDAIFPPGGDPALATLTLQFFSGVQPIHPERVFDVAPPAPGHAVFIHVRDAVACQWDNNCGWIEAAGLLKNAFYHCACEVWIPHDFAGQRLAIECSDLAASHVSIADLDVRGKWQTIRVMGTARWDRANFVIRCDSDMKSNFLTSALRVGPGEDGPGFQVFTPV